MRRETLAFFEDLIRIPSISGGEDMAVSFVAERLRPLCDELAHAPIPPEITRDPDYSSPIPDLSYAGRSNIRAALGRGRGRTLIVNTHVDVVPPAEGQPAPFTPTVRDGALFGRGACDAKGQIASLYEALCLIRDQGTRLTGRLVIHIVVEEENGGNGALALVRHGEKADGALVLEPTDLAIAPSSRSSVWFRVVTRGTAAHSGRSGRGTDALKRAMTAMGIVERCHEQVLAASRGNPLFDVYGNPMPLTFGTLHAGTWPATTPGEAVIQGVFAFLPTSTREEVMALITRSLGEEESLADACAVTFPFRHDCHVTSPEEPVIRELVAAARATGVLPRLIGFPASSDAWLYRNLLGIPTAIFGPGRIQDAHACDEHVRLDDVDRAAEVLARFIRGWCAEE